MITYNLQLKCKAFCSDSWFSFLEIYILSWKSSWIGFNFLIEASEDSNQVSGAILGVYWHNNNLLIDKIRRYLHIMWNYLEETSS